MGPAPREAAVDTVDAVVGQTRWPCYTGSAIKGTSCSAPSAADSPLNPLDAPASADRSGHPTPSLESMDGCPVPSGWGGRPFRFPRSFSRAILNMKTISTQGTPRWEQQLRPSVSGEGEMAKRSVPLLDSSSILGGQLEDGGATVVAVAMRRGTG
jgi:hypothetical protein